MLTGIPSERKIRALHLLLLLSILVSVPSRVAAWGRNAHKLVVNQAIDTLPQDLRGFFESNRALLLQDVIHPLDAVTQTPAEKRKAHLYLDKYDGSPFDSLPHNYK